MLAGRNSYSKTDPDATFMRMKEDHMRNGQLKPGYNIQMGTENQYILGYSIHQRPTDTGCLVPHLEHVKAMTGIVPASTIADAGYGSEENYQYLDQIQCRAFVKYNTFRQETKKSWRKKNPYHVQFFKHDETGDVFYCPEGKPLHCVKTMTCTSENKFACERRVYEADACNACPVKIRCTKAVGNRSIQVSLQLMKFRQRARELLDSEQGRQLRSRRCVEIEPVFGNIKQNAGFRRFHLAGIPKVHLEWGLVAMAHNLRKMSIGR
jgi:hypothetical protein